METVEREGAAALTATEAETVDAIVARLIPTDANGPGGAEAKAGRYIDWALGGGLAFFKDSYTLGTTPPTRKTAYDFDMFKKLKSRQKGTNRHGGLA